MKWKSIIVGLAAFAAVAFVLSPTVMWDGREEFTLALSAGTAAATDSLFYREQGNLKAGERLCEFYLTENLPDVDQLFRPVTVSSDRQFTVEVPTCGTTRLWGLWRKRGMYEYVILMGKTKTGDRKFKCVSVKATEPIDMK